MLNEGAQAAQGLEVEANENAASEETAGKFSIKNGMTDEERYNELKDKTIVVVPFNQSALAETGEDIDSLIGKYKKDAMLVIAPVAEKLGVYKKYENGTVKLEFNYSKKQLEREHN